jgi:hypothetical protein
MEFGKPRQSLTGIVGAGEDGVWNALLETWPYLTPRMREMIAGSRGMLRFRKARVQDRDAGFQALAFAAIAGKARFSASFQSPIGAMPAACHALWPRTL